MWLSCLGIWQMSWQNDTYLPLPLPPTSIFYRTYLHAEPPFCGCPNLRVKMNNDVKIQTFSFFGIPASKEWFTYTHNWAALDNHFPSSLCPYFHRVSSIFLIGDFAQVIFHRFLQKNYWMTWQSVPGPMCPRTQSLGCSVLWMIHPLDYTSLYRRLIGYGVPDQYVLWHDKSIWVRSGSHLTRPKLT